MASYEEGRRLVEDSETPVVPASPRSRVVLVVLGSVGLLAAVGSVVLMAPSASNTPITPKASALEKVVLAGDSPQALERDFNKDFGEGTACRADCEDTTVHGRNNITLLTIATLDECVDKCKNDEKCTGIEFSSKNRRCELWRIPVGKVYKRNDFRCISFLKTAKCDVDDGSGRSSVYPCACGDATCSEAAGLCHAETSMCAQKAESCPEMVVPEETKEETCKTKRELQQSDMAGSCDGRCTATHKCCPDTNRCVPKDSSCSAPPKDCVGTCGEGWNCCIAQGNQCLKHPILAKADLCTCQE